MSQPELFVVTGPNAAGKSSFIRSRLNDFSRFEIIMTEAFDIIVKNIDFNRGGFL